MSTIALPLTEETVMSLWQMAESQGTTAEALAEQAIRRYLRQQAEANSDELALYLRIRQRFPLIGILIKKVTDEPEEIWMMRLQIGAHTLPRVRVAGVPAGTDLILGRNVLNQMRVTLDGPALTTEIP